MKDTHQTQIDRGWENYCDWQAKKCYFFAVVSILIGIAGFFINGIPVFILVLMSIGYFCSSLFFIGMARNWKDAGTPKQ